MSTKNIDLPLKIRRKPKKVRQSKRMLGMRIDGRPESADACDEFGHIGKSTRP
jgi:hypothetical protein